MKSCFALVLLGFWLLATQSVFAEGGPKVAYQATFEFNAPGSGRMTNTSWSDGRGHTRTEQTVAGRKSATIVDFTNKQILSLQQETKTAIRLPMSETAWRQDPEYMKRQNWQLLGAKVIEGHPCTGYQITTDGHTTQVWTGTDTDCTVLTLQDGKPQMKLLSFQRMNPPSSLFALPAGYKMLEMPDMTKTVTTPGGAGAGQDWTKYLPKGTPGAGDSSNSSGLNKQSSTDD